MRHQDLISSPQTISLCTDALREERISPYMCIWGVSNPCGASAVRDYLDNHNAPTPFKFPLDVLNIGDLSTRESQDQFRFDALLLYHIERYLSLPEGDRDKEYGLSTHKYLPIFQVFHDLLDSGSEPLETSRHMAI